ncbi:MAG: hypothetical protein QM755_23810 [Luteolibacter sp.]
MSDQLAPPPTDQERKDNAREVQRLHPAERFQLMKDRINTNPTKHYGKPQ